MNMYMKNISEKEAKQIITLGEDVGFKHKQDEKYDMNIYSRIFNNKEYIIVEVDSYSEIINENVIYYYYLESENGGKL